MTVVAPDTVVLSLADALSWPLPSPAGLAGGGKARCTMEGLALVNTYCAGTEDAKDEGAVALLLLLLVVVVAGGVWAEEEEVAAVDLSEEEDAMPPPPLLEPAVNEAFVVADAEGRLGCIGVVLGGVEDFTEVEEGLREGEGVLSTLDILP